MKSTWQENCIPLALWNENVKKKSSRIFSNWVQYIQNTSWSSWIYCTYGLHLNINLCNPSHQWSKSEKLYNHDNWYKSKGFENEWINVVDIVWTLGVFTIEIGGCTCVYLQKFLKVWALIYNIFLPSFRLAKK